MSNSGKRAGEKRAPGDVSGGVSGGVRHVVILGLMGAGKTTVGRLVAEGLGWRLDDSDEAIERRWGADVRTLNERLGTARMHELEAEHLRGAVLSESPSVIAAAASVIEHAACRAVLASPGVVGVWLDAEIGALVSRFAERSHRPLLGDDPRTMLEHQHAVRDPLFEQACSIRVAADGRTPSQVAAEIIAALPRGA